MLVLTIVGGSDAGISAALRARELDPSVKVHLIVADAYPNFSICGLPFYLSGEVTDWRTLAHRTVRDIEAAGVRLHLTCTATRINAASKTVTIRRPSGQEDALPYGKLVIATGAVPLRPPIPGLDVPGVFVLHTMDESFLFDAHREKARPTSVAIIGAGYIGLEMADAMRHRGIEVTLIEQLPTVMKTVDASFGNRVAELLRLNGVKVRTNTIVREITQTPTALMVHGEDLEVAAEMVLVVTGVRALSDLAPSAGVATDRRGAIIVDDHMRTNVVDIFAAGDCVQTWNRILQSYAYMPLGTTAHKQGRVAGENAVGGDAVFAGSLGTQSVKIFDKVVAATGLREVDAITAGFDVYSAELTANDHKAYYPAAKPMVLHVIGEKNDHRLLGAQIIGAWGTEVSKRIDIFATAIFNGMRVDDLIDLDLSYTPPLSSPWDPVQMAAQTWLLQVREASAQRPLSGV